MTCNGRGCVLKWLQLPTAAGFLLFDRSPAIPHTIEYYVRHAPVWNPLCRRKLAGKPNGRTAFNLGDQ